MSLVRYMPILVLLSSFSLWGCVSGGGHTSMGGTILHFPDAKKAFVASVERRLSEQGIATKLKTMDTQNCVKLAIKGDGFVGQATIQSSKVSLHWQIEYEYRTWFFRKLPEHLDEDIAKVSAIFREASRAIGHTYPPSNRVRAVNAQDADKGAISETLLPGVDTETLANSKTEEVEKNNQPQPIVGQNWTVPDVGVEFVWISALNCWVGKYEVTNGEYRKFKPDHSSSDYQGFSLNGDRQPVAMVNYKDVVAFADWLTKREKKAGRLPFRYGYRLPSGDEWTVFAQCGDGRKYPWGNTWPPTYGNYADKKASEAFLNWPRNIISNGYKDGYEVSCPVEESGKNDWGLYGVGGNIYEWTSEVVGSSRVLRGATWCVDKPDDLSCTRRDIYPPYLRNWYNGFRLLLSKE